MSTLKVPLEGSLTYRGREGQWAYLLHRLTGLGTLLFLTIHILDTSTVYFLPDLYEHAIAIYRLTPFMLGEIVLVFCVLYHGVNGLRVALFDLRPELWSEARQRSSFWWTIALSLAFWLPAAYLMGRAIVEHNL